MKTVLSNLNSIELITQLKTMVQREKALVLEILEYLREVEQRQLYLPSHTSLFSFMVDELGYSPSLAHLRLNSIRALQIVPEARAKILNNQLSLNQLAKTQSFINQIHRTSANNESFSIAEQRELFAAVEETAVSQMETVLHAKKHEIEVRKAEAQGLPTPILQPLVKKITLEGDPELMGMLVVLKSLLSHSHPGADWSILLKESLPLAIQELKIKRGLIKRSENKTIKKTNKNKSNLFINLIESNENKIACIDETPSMTSSMKSGSVEKRDSCANRITRAIPTLIKREVWKRDQGCCQYVDPKTKKQCGSHHQLQFDHTRPWSLGGEHSVENLSLHCSQHNRFRWNSMQKT